MNLSQALLHALHQHGAREIFGIPGDFILAFFRQIETTGILPMYTLSHEPAVIQEDLHRAPHRHPADDGQAFRWAILAPGADLPV